MLMSQVQLGMSVFCLYFVVRKRGIGAHSPLSISIITSILDLSLSCQITSPVFKMSHRTTARARARSAIQPAQAVQGFISSRSLTPSGSSDADTALRISSTILTVLQNATAVSPVSFIRPAADLALMIVEKIQVIFESSSIPTNLLMLTLPLYDNKGS